MAETEKKTAAPTAYVILRADSARGRWIVASDHPVLARSKSLAIDAFYEASGKNPGAYKAVAASSWSGIVVKEEENVTVTKTVEINGVEEEGFAYNPVRPTPKPADPVAA